MDDRLQADLRRWTGAGLITESEAAAILQHERRSTSPSRTIGDEDTSGVDEPSTAAEVVGYVGAALALSAGGLIVEQYWDRFTAWGQVTLLALLTVVLVLAGLALRHRPSGAARRLVSVLWLAAVVSTAFTGGVAVERDLVAIPERGIALTISGLTVVVAAALYRLGPSTLQQIALALPVAAVGMSVVGLPRGPVDEFFFGLVLWASGLAWVLLGQGRWLWPTPTAHVLGLLGMGIGGQIMVVGDHASVGHALVLSTVAIVLATGLRQGWLVWLGFGVFGTVLFVPQAVFHFFGDTLGAPLALLVTGLLLVVGAVGLLPLRRRFRAGAA